VSKSILDKIRGHGFHFERTWMMIPEPSEADLDQVALEDYEATQQWPAELTMFAARCGCWIRRAVHAEAKVGAAKKLAEALESLEAEQNGPPLLGRHELRWNEAMAKTKAALATWNDAEKLT